MIFEKIGAKYFYSSMISKIIYSYIEFFFRQKYMRFQGTGKFCSYIESSSNESLYIPNRFCRDNPCVSVEFMNLSHWPHESAESSYENIFVFIFRHI